MKRTHKLLSLLLALTMVFTLAACGNGDDSQGSGSPAPSNSQPAQPADSNSPSGGEASGETVTLNWAIWDKDSTAYWSALAEGYMATHENVKIEMTDLGSNDMTLEDYDALARQMTSGSGAEKVYGAHYHTWRSAVSLFGILDGQHTIVDGSYDFLKPIYEMVLKEQEDGIVYDFGELKTANLHYSAAFQNGSAAMVNMGSWFLATMQKYNAEAAGNGVEPVNFGMVKYPHPAGVEAGSTLGTVTSLGVNANSANKEAAIDFCNWCAGPEGAAIMASTGSFPAVSTDETVNAIAATEGFPEDANSKDALTTSAIYLEMPYSTKASEIETVLNTEHDAIMTGSETVDEGIANMNEQVQAILNG